MKGKLMALSGGALTTVLLLALLPVLMLAASPSAGPCGSGAAATSVVAIAATIRHLESGDDYSARAPGSSASGAYQFLDSSWGGYGGYERAYLAPREVQDAKALEHINGILASNDNDPAAVPVVWYIGHVPAPESAEWDTVPAPGAGNRLTPREYQRRWMDVYREKLTGPTTSSSPGGSGTIPSLAQACGGGLLAISGSYALPLERSWYDQHLDWFTKPHHDYPAVDIPVPIGTPVYAATAGVVVSVTSGGSCGFGVVINGDDGAQYTYCHGLPGSHAIANGDAVRTGQLIMKSASTGKSTGPHLHFSIRVDGQDRCPQPFLVAIADGHPLDVAALPPSGCSY